MRRALLRKPYGAVLESLCFSLAAQYGISYYYVPSDFSGLYSDSAASVPFVAGDTVGSVVDSQFGAQNRKLGSSALGSLASQSVAGSRPTVTATAPGRFGFLFDGSDDGLLTTHATPAASGETLIVGYQRGTAGTADTPVARTNALGTQGTRVNVTNGNVWRYQNQAGATTTVNLASAGGTAAFVCSGTSTGTSQVGRVNGQRAGTAAGTFTPASTGVSIGIDGDLTQPASGIISLAAYAPIVLPDEVMLVFERFAAYQLGFSI